MLKLSKLSCLLALLLLGHCIHDSAAFQQVPNIPTPRIPTEHYVTSMEGAASSSAATSLSSPPSSPSSLSSRAKVGTLESISHKRSSTHNQRRGPTTTTTTSSSSLSFGQVVESSMMGTSSSSPFGIATRINGNDHGCICGQDPCICGVRYGTN